MPTDNDEIQEFESRLTSDPPPKDATGAPRIMKASEAATIASDPDVKTSQKNLLAIVNTRIQAAAKDGKKSLEKPFAGLIRPANEETKIAVLEELEQHGYTFEPGDEIDGVVIRW
jgi:hypothetical protein